jgi:hypothetical protein
MMTEHENVLATEGCGAQPNGAVEPASERGTGESENQGNEKNLPMPLSPVKPRLISQRKLEANRANAKKSTGPRTARGKACSRRNAIRHGLTSTTGVFHCDGTPHDPELRPLWQALHEKFGGRDATTDALIEEAVTEWAHQIEAFRLEQSRPELTAPLPDSAAGLASLHRYIRKSERALLRTLRVLAERRRWQRLF